MYSRIQNRGGPNNIMNNHDNITQLILSCLTLVLAIGLTSLTIMKEIYKRMTHLKAIFEMLKDNELPESTTLVEGIESYPWHVDTKYYTADVALCTTHRRTIGDREFAENVQAFVVHFDPREKSTFDQTKSWLPFLKEIEPEILMLLCNRSTDKDAVPRQTVLAWCLENSFELVELNPLEDSDDEDNDFKETTGIKRIIQALHAHTWPNLVMKDEKSFRSPFMQEMMRAEALAKASLADKDQEKSTGTTTEHSAAAATHKQSSSSSSSSSEPTKTDTDRTLSDSVSCTDGQQGQQCRSVDTQQDGAKVKPAAADGLDSIISEDDLRLFSMLGTDDPGEESFEQLFERMRTMKEKADALPHDQRKAYAEQVAISFWKAIGGDSEEIQGLSDSD